MNDEQYTPALGTWLKDSDVAPPDPQTSARQIMAELPESQKPRSWWPFRRRATPAPPPAIPSTEYQPTPIPATNGHTPTASVRTQSMFSPVKAITAGALVFALGGVLLIAQPFDQQGGSVPGAATDGDRPAIEKVTGQFVSVVGGPEPDFRYGISPDGGDYYRNEVNVGGAEMSDERLSGKVTITWNNDHAAGDYVTVDWGTVSIENDAGAWLGTHTFLYLSGEGPEVVYMELVGSEAYEGWSAILYAPEVDVNSDFIHGDHLVYGAVFSGNLPPDRESYLPE